MSDLSAQTMIGLPPANQSEARSGLNDVLLACGLAWAGSLIHLQAAIDHIDEYWLYALFFIALAAAQFVWAIALYRSPRRSLLIAGGVLSLAVVGLWVVSRTIGLPIGPDLGNPEPVGLLDAVATADELAIAALMALRLGGPPTERRPGRAMFLRVGAIFLIVLSSLVLAGGVHAH